MTVDSDSPGIGWLVAGAVVVAVLLCGWVFPAPISQVAGPWAVPSLAIVAAVGALASLARWPVACGSASLLAVVAFTSWQPASVSHLVGLCIGFVVMALVANGVSSQRRLRFALLGLVAGGLVVLLVGLAGAPVRVGTVIDHLMPSQPVALGLEGLQSSIVNQNALAAGVLLIAPIGVAILAFVRLQAGSVLPILSGALVSLGLLVLLVANSRSAWLAVLIVAAVTMLQFPRGRRLVAVSLLVATAVLGILVARSPGALSPSTDLRQSYHDRMYVMSEGVRLFRDAPWFGIGLNEFRQTFTPRPSPAAHAHNIALQTALDVRVIGSAGYWGLQVFLLVSAGRLSRSTTGLARAAVVGGAWTLLAVHAFGMTDAVALGAKVGVFQWTSAGLILAVGAMADEPQSS